MLAFGCKKSTGDPLVDIEQPLIDYAWSNLSDANVFERIFKRHLYDFDVNLSYLTISHDLDPETFRGNMADGSARLSTVNRCLFETEFKNLSDQPQKFTFKTERKTTSRYDVHVQTGYKIGGNVDINIPLQNVVKVGLTGELHVTKSTGQTFEEVMTWSVDNQVVVESQSGCKAEMLIQEIDMTRDFVVRSTVVAPKGKVLVNVRHRKSKDVLKVLEIPSHLLKDIFQRAGVKLADVPTAAAAESDGTEGSIVKVPDDVVCIETRGTMRAVYGAKQFIEIKQFQIE